MKESIQFVNSFVFLSVYLTGGTLGSPEPPIFRIPNVDHIFDHAVCGITAAETRSAILSECIKSDVFKVDHYRNQS